MVYSHGDPLDPQPDDTVEFPVIHHETKDHYEPGELVEVPVVDMDAAQLDEWLRSIPLDAPIEIHVWRPVPPDAA